MLCGWHDAWSIDRPAQMCPAAGRLAAVVVRDGADDIHGLATGLLRPDRTPASRSMGRPRPGCLVTRRSTG